MKHLSLVGRVIVLATAVAVVIGVMSVAALLAILSLRQAENEEKKSAARTVATLRVENLAVDAGSAVRGYALTQNPRFLDLYNAARDRLPAALKTLDAAVAGDPMQRSRAAAAREQIREYIDDYAEPVILLANSSPDAARGTAAGRENLRRAAEIRATLSRITALEGRRSASRSAHVRDVTNSAIFVGAVALVLSAALVLLFGAWVAREVARPVRETTKAAAQVAAGDFEVRLDERAAGEVGALVSAFNSMARSLETGRREVLAQNQQLRESEQHKRDLISMVSHELRTPLASVLGFTTLLLERAFPPDEQRRYLEIVDTQARRLAALAGDFLDVQLLEGGGMRLERAPVDLIELTNEQTRLFFSHLDTHTLDLELPEEPIVIDGDRDRLAQVIGNLLSNAIKYSPEGGTVRVQMEVDGDHAVLMVNDQGMGIDEEDREHVFEKFFRSSEASARISGTGLGLAVAREIVETHGGEIHVQSEPGAGSTFWIELPLRRTAATAALEV
jgi:signal transduction histidine kinase